MREQRGGKLMRPRDAQTVFIPITFIATKRPRAKRPLSIASAEARVILLA
jgi:hypothetical protein